MLGLLAGSLAAAGTFKFQLSDKVQVGQTQLKPGQYVLDVNGSAAVLERWQLNSNTLPSSVARDFKASA